VPRRLGARSLPQRARSCRSSITHRQQYRA
jgi:hypothetical protein